MDQSIELVSRHCGNQLNSFQRCILANRADVDGGESACLTQRKELSNCAANAVPIVAKIKEHCQDQIRLYDACLLAGAHDSDDQITQRCTPALRNLWQCTEAVKRQESIKSGNIPKGGKGFE